MYLFSEVACSCGRIILFNWFLEHPASVSHVGKVRGFTYSGSLTFFQFLGLVHDYYHDPYSARPPRNTRRSLSINISPQPDVQLTYCKENFEAIAPAYTEIRLMAATGHARKHPELSKAKLRWYTRLMCLPYAGGFEGQVSRKIALQAQLLFIGETEILFFKKKIIAWFRSPSSRDIVEIGLALEALADILIMFEFFERASWARDPLPFFGWSLGECL